MRVNPNLAATASPPIMEVQRWLRETKLRADLPLINLSQAAPAGPPPESLRRHLSQAVLDDPSAHLYGPVLGNAALRAAIASRWSADYAASISPGQVAVTAGCNQAFCVAVATACAPGDAVMLPFPWYFNHRMWLDMSGIGCVPLPCGEGMLPDLDAARAAMTPDVRAIVLVTPNNPTGAEYPNALLQGFYDLAAEAGAALIVDETYRDFHSSPGVPHGLFNRGGWEEVLVHLYSFSKVFRLTGHRTGALIAGEGRLAAAEKFLDTVTISPPQTGQIAALYGLEHLSQWVAEERDEVLARRAALLAALRGLSGWTVHGAGAYFAWVEPPFDLPAQVTARRLLAEQSLLVLPGGMFVPAGRPTRALRVAFANADAGGLAETGRRLAAFRP
ncbi:MAG TPA: aminotransferase [Paracoccaceae bacterium]|nr:aminotransferase [Paracoccaceae bacterium]